MSVAEFVDCVIIIAGIGVLFVAAVLVRSFER